MAEKVVVEKPKIEHESGEKQEPTTVGLGTEIKPKHPLQNTWDLWYYKNVTPSFENNLFTITSVDTVEDFWGLFNHIELASRLTLNCAYYFFKKNIRPMWEDEPNKNGGRWLLNSRKNLNSTDDYWLELLMCLIGEGFGDYNDQICGASVVIKKAQDRIGVWTRDASNKEAMMHIGNVIKQRINYTGPIQFEPHDSKQKQYFYQA